MKIKTKLFIAYTIPYWALGLLSLDMKYDEPVIFYSLSTPILIISLFIFVRLLMRLMASLEDVDRDAPKRNRGILKTVGLILLLSVLIAVLRGFIPSFTGTKLEELISVYVFYTILFYLVFYKVKI